MARLSRRTGVSAERVVRELARVAFASMPDAVDMCTATLKPDATADDRAAIASVRVKDGDVFTEREIRMCDKVRALELLASTWECSRTTCAWTAPCVIIDDVGAGDG